MYLNDYFIDEKGIYTVKSSSYPDAVWDEYLVRFDNNMNTDFQKFVKKLREEGEENARQRIRSAIGAKGFL